ncbi:unnamed protein product [Pleuronectes platessa]|uniref:Uncharacterized protein n=1 Tax=Pleuronectes platessa TaxID=8262 RepID=A0A9N7TWD1_PLEPL|nr:unnamed protein product [Pleuronectes platessa]
MKRDGGGGGGGGCSPLLSIRRHEPHLLQYSVGVVEEQLKDTQSSEQPCTAPGEQMLVKPETNQRPFLPIVQVSATSPPPLAVISVLTRERREEEEEEEEEEEGVQWGGGEAVVLPALCCGAQERHISRGCDWSTASPVMLGKCQPRNQPGPLSPEPDSGAQHDSDMIMDGGYDTCKQ